MYNLNMRAKGNPKQAVVAAECEKKCRARRVTLMKNKYRFGPESRGIFQQTRIYIKSAVRRKVFRIHAHSIYKDAYFLRGRKKPRPWLSVLQIKTCYSCGQIWLYARTQSPGAHGARCKKQQDVALCFYCPVDGRLARGTCSAMLLIVHYLLNLINSPPKIMKRMR
jgi:hypothetical protein